MSYILDALKKNKPGNEKEQVPDISSVHDSEYDYSDLTEESSLKRWFWPVVVMILLLLVATLTFMLLNPSAREVSQQLIQTQRTASTNATIEDVKNTAEPTEKSTQNNNSRLPEEQRIKTGDAVVVSKPLKVGEPVVRKVVKPNVRTTPSSTSQKNTVSKKITKSDLPKIIYTTHIYATQPGDRFVMLNGRAYAEGDKTQEGFLIKEILENDLLIMYKGQEFTLPSLEDVN